MARTDRPPCGFCLRIRFALGRFEAIIDGRTEILETASGIIVASDPVHGVKALEAGRLGDGFQK